MQDAVNYEVGGAAHSTLREKVLEHTFIADLSRTFWQQGIRDFEILRAEVDRGGYDLVVGRGNRLRHIQLKSSHASGKAAGVPIQVALGSKPGGCVIWMFFHPATLALGPFLWLGKSPAEPIGDLGDKVVRHTKGNKDGNKAERPGLRMVPRSRFTRLETMAEVVQQLFGDEPSIVFAETPRLWSDAGEELDV
jgi:hypothetical protein